jgi:TPR repeat protein
MSHLLRALLLSTSLLILPHQAVLADDIDGFAGRDKASQEAVESLEAYAVYKMGQYDEARIIWLSLASRNNTSAMINLANMAEQGQGVPRDLSSTAKWLRKAAELGDQRGQLQLGLAYEKGLGVERDPKKAADWFLKAAEQGDSTAQFNLGVMLATNYGKGIKSATPEQRQAAIKWLEKAAEDDQPDADTFLDMLNSLNPAQ